VYWGLRDASIEPANVSTVLLEMAFF